jgi:hypothetical protein
VDQGNEETPCFMPFSLNRDPSLLRRKGCWSLLERRSNPQGVEPGLSLGTKARAFGHLRDLAQDKGLPMFHLSSFVVYLRVCHSMLGQWRQAGDGTRRLALNSINRLSLAQRRFFLSVARFKLIINYLVKE